MKNLKITIVVMLLFTGAVNAQKQLNSIDFSLYQDAKLLITGDNLGNDAGTLNLLARVELKGYQKKGYYFSVFPEFEIAALKDRYIRYSINMGWTFNQWFQNWEYNVSVGYGIIDRFTKAFFSSGGSMSISYGKNLKVSLLLQATDRTDLKYAYNTDGFKFSGFVGLKYNIR